MTEDPFADFPNMTHILTRNRIRRQKGLPPFNSDAQFCLEAKEWRKRLESQIQEWREKANLLEFLEELFEADFAKARKYLEKDNQWWEDHENLKAVKTSLRDAAAWKLITEVTTIDGDVEECIEPSDFDTFIEKLRAAAEGSQP